MNRMISVFMAVVLAASFMMSTAQAAEKVRSQMLAYVVTSENGKETLKKAATAEPGNVLEYQLAYTNTSAEAMSGLNVAVPVPANTRYLDKTAITVVPSRFEVSIDGGKTWEGEPVKRLRKDNNGQLKEVVIPATEYTNLRWLVQRPLKGGEVQQFTYRIQVI
ncbi:MULTISPECIES: hypothetical protein [unclassified Endozoicomonas]|uniref:hypothetical protein n=1 Tax=unclassified Endozoicomonas TaxID=2644528 RepID=UPI003BB745E8